MKLHLPKQLFTALLAAITLAAAPLSPAATTYTGTFAWAASDDESTDAVDESTLRLTLPADTPFSVALTSTVGQMATGTHNTSSYRPNTNVGTGGTWGLTFNLTTPEGGDSDIIGYSITGITLTAFTFNSSGGAQNNDERYFDLSLGGDLTGGISNKQITASNTGAFNLTTVDTGSELVDNEFTITATAGDSNPTTDGGSYLGLKEISLTAFAVISSTAEVTWTNSTGATWSGESWQTTTGTIGALANATAGTAKFTGDAAGSAYTVDVDTAASAGQLNVTSGDYTFAGTGSLSVTTGMNIAEDASAILEVDATLSGTIENAGSLKLGGTGTTTIDGIISGAGSLTVNKTGEGKVVLNAANTYTGNTTIESGVLSITDQAALGTGKTTVMSGAALAWGTTLTNNNGDKTQNTAFLTLEALNGDADITTKEGGYIQLTYTNSNDGREIRLGAAGENGKDLELKKNFQFMNSHGVAVHGGGSNLKLTITNATLKSDYAVDAVSQATIVVNGGALIAGSMNLGHTSTNGGHYGKLTMADGSIQTGTITFRKSKSTDTQTSNAIEITGGSLEFTNATALNYSYNNVTDSTSSITIGGTGDKNVILKATKTAWTLDGAGRAQIQNITIDTDNQYAITLQNVNINGTITNNASLTNASLTLGAFTVATGTTATLGGTGITTASGIISGAGALKKTGTGTTTLSGANNYTGGTTIEGGTLKVTHASALGSNKTVNITAGTLDVATTGENHATLAGADITMGAGAILKNSGNHIWANQNLIHTLTLTSNAEINNAYGLGLVNVSGNSYSATTLNLNGHTLTKKGGGNFALVDTAVNGGGIISVEGGKLLIAHSNKESDIVATGTTVQLNDGKLAIENNNSSLTVDSVTGNGTVQNNGTLILAGSAKGGYSFAGTITGVDGKGDDQSNGKGTLEITAGTHTFTGSTIANKVKLTNESSTLVLSSASEQNIAYTVSGAGTLQKDGAGTATVARVENMSGALTVNGGALNVTALSDMSGALTVNGGTLTVTTLSGARNFEKKGTGIATLTTVNNITDGFTVSAGELSIDTFNVDTTLNLTVAADATLNLHNVVVNAQSNLNLLEGITPTRTYTTDTANPTESTDNGYLVEYATYVLFDGYAWNGSVAGYTVEATTDKTLLKSSGLSSHMMYYVNSGTENYDSGSVIASDATKGIVLKGGTTLNMSTSLNANATAIEVDGASSNSATINLAADTVTLSKNQLSINSGTVTLTGSGVYDLGMVTDLGKTNNTFADYLGAVTVGNDWTGTIKLSGTAKGLYLNHKGSTSSWLQLDGLTGWFATEDTTRTGIHTANLNLTGNGLIVDDNSTRLYKHTGAIKGSGDYTIQTISGYTPTYEFIGDLSKWAGAFVVKQHATDQDKPDVTLNLTNGGTLYSGAATSGIRMEREGTLTVNIGNADSAGVVGEEGATGSTIMCGAISNTSSGTLNLNVKGSTSFAQNVTVTSMTVDAGKTATVKATLSAGTVNLGSNATVTAGTMSGVKLADSGITAATNGTQGSISDADIEIAQLAEDASFTIEDMTLMNTKITAATTTEVKLKNVTATNTMLAQGNYTLSGLNAEVSTPEVGNVSISYSTGLGVDSGATLTLNLDVLGAVEQHGSGVYDITITLNGFGTGDEFPQEDLTSLVKFDADSWLGEVISNVTKDSIVDEQQVATLSDNVGAAATPSVSYTATPSVGTLVITITGLNVPEPASATLGLAALMMLCARRRRKA